MGKIDRKAMKEELLRRTKESDARKDDSGKFGNIFKDEMDLPIWKCKEGEHIIDIIPYTAGPHDPKNKEGAWAYGLEVFVHSKVGVTQDDAICMARTYGQKCPICEHQNKMSNSGKYSDDEIKKFNATRRVAYNIICYDNNSEENKGVQIYMAAHFSFEQNLLAIARKPRGGGYIPFSDPDDGKSIVFTRKGTKLNTKLEGFMFEDRPSPISDEVLEDAITIDEYIHLPDYDELKEKFTEGLQSVPEEEEEERGSRRSRRGGDDEEEDSGSSRRSRRNKSEDDEDSGSSRRSRRSSEDEEPSSRRRAKDEEEEPSSRRKRKSEDDEEETSPRRKSKKSDEDEDEAPKKSRKSEDEDEDEPKSKKKTKSDDDEDEEPKSKKLKKKEPEPEPEAEDEDSAEDSDSDEAECPHGGEFGKDLDSMKQCGKCKLWDDCSVKYEELAKAKKKNKRK